MLRLFRYRFFVFATPLPYILGAAAGFESSQSFHLSSFLLGLVGIILASGGVETFNEYFDPSDSALHEMRGIKSASRRTLYLGIAFFIAAFLIGLYLSWSRSPWVLLFAALGFFTAAFYVGPPFRLAYKGLGEVAIFFTYGPLLVLGSYYLQTLRQAPAPVLISLIPGSLIFALAILNEIPDYYWDKLSGKKTLVVRMGKKRGAFIYGAALMTIYLLQALAVLGKALPPWSLLIWLTLPIAWKIIKLVWRHHENPHNLLPAVNATILFFLGFNIFFVIILFI